MGIPFLYSVAHSSLLLTQPNAFARSIIAISRLLGPVCIACSMRMIASIVDTPGLYPYFVLEVSRCIICVILAVSNLDHIL